MRKKIFKRALALALASVMTLGMAACGNEVKQPASESVPSQTTSESTAASESTAPEKKELQTITLYPNNASLTSGVVGGYMGELFADLGFEVEVWAYSDEKTNAILASGDLPDIMYVKPANVDTMIQAGMLLNLEEYIDKMPHVANYPDIQPALNFVREYRSNNTGTLYGLPLQVGMDSATAGLADTTERNALKLNWEAYEKIGAPEINNYDELLDVMEEMVKASPTGADGAKNFGTILNGGYDSEYWSCMTMWYRLNGYIEYQLGYLLEMNMASGEVDYILSEDSMYYKGLKWYNEAFNRGLVDPDSVANDRATQSPKVSSGHAMVPTGTLPGWASTYLPYYVPGTNIYYSVAQPYGSSSAIVCVNAETEKLDTCLAFLDMLADPDAYLVARMGPEGEFWYVDANGDAMLTEAGYAYMKENLSDAANFTTSTGETIALWNTPFITHTGTPTTYGDGQGGKRLVMATTWHEYKELAADNPLYKQWQETTGYSDWMEWLEAEKAHVATSSLDTIGTFLNTPDDEMKLYKDSIKDVVVNASWQIVCAKTEKEFNDLWNKMVSDCEGLGAKDIAEWRLADIANAQAIKASLAE